MPTKPIMTFLMAIFLTIAPIASAGVCDSHLMGSTVPLGSPEHFSGLLDELFPSLTPDARAKLKVRFFGELANQIRTSKNAGVYNHPDRNRLWEKDSFEIVSYPDQVSRDGGRGDLTSLKRGLEALGQHLGETGANFNLTTHILPPFSSPMIDQGYDVSDLTGIRSELGGLEAMKKLLELQNGTGSVKYKFVLDIIANHISENSELFQRALMGDEKALKMFVVTFKEPKQKLKVINGAKWVEYEISNPDGSVTEQDNRLIFPDFAKTHFHKIRLDDGRELFAFSYFYKQQKDWDWRNPEVLFEYLKVINFWANQGIDLFRLDAIPFLEKSQESHPRTLKIVELLKAYLDVIAPHVHFRTESNQEIEVVKSFLGESVEGLHPVTKERRATNRLSTGAYSFPILPKKMATLLSGQKRFLEEGLKQLADFPETSVLTPMLRTHDESTLEMATEEERDIQRKELLINNNRGERFRGDTDEEALGVSGSLASFLAFDPNRIAQAFAILFSQPGIPSVQLRDMFGLGNDYEYAKELGRQTGTYDSRNIHRSRVPLAMIEAGGLTPLQKRVFKDFKKIIRARFSSLAMRYGSLRVVENRSPQVSSIMRSYKGKDVLILHNVSATDQKVFIHKNDLAFHKAPASFFDLLEQKHVNLIVRPDGLELTMAAHQSLMLEVHPKP
jgi:maltose alpha-D-glucosyltransferase / alpha-amylase